MKFEGTMPASRSLWSTEDLGPSARTLLFGARLLSSSFSFGSLHTSIGRLILGPPSKSARPIPRTTLASVGGASSVRTLASHWLSSTCRKSWADGSKVLPEAPWQVELPMQSTLLLMRVLLGQKLMRRPTIWLPGSLILTPPLIVASFLFCSSNVTGEMPQP